MRGRFLVIGVEACALVCLVVAYVNRDEPPPSSIEGAYFNRSVGSEGSVVYARVGGGDDYSRFDNFDIWDPYLWLGAGLTLAAVGIAILVVSLRAQPPGDTGRDAIFRGLLP